MRDIVFNNEKTESRLIALEQYAREAGISPTGFHCRSVQSCNASLAEDLRLKAENCGGLAHVGENYDVSVDGQELRILFVGKDYGWGNSELRARRTDIQTYSDKPNPHYKGVIKVLMEIFQDRCEDSSWRLLLRRMAQTNATRCTAPRESQTGKASMNSNITITMRTNCWDHFKREIEVLEPTLIWFHDADAQDSFLGAISKERLSPTLPFEDHERCQLVEWTIFQKPFTSTIGFFHHPAYGHFGRQWETAREVIARLRKVGYLPTFDKDWKPLQREEWPSL